jgi:hypothetical protein
MLGESQSNTNSKVRGVMDVAGNAGHVVELARRYLLSSGHKAAQSDD